MGRRPGPTTAAREVRQFIRDNALMWLEEYHVDGLRFDMTLYIRNVRGDDGDPGDGLPDGWSLLQWINGEVARALPGRITIAEDLRDNGRITRADDDGGAGFGAQWDAQFVHPIRAVLIAGSRRGAAHGRRSRTRSAITTTATPSARVIYTESHDEVRQRQGAGAAGDRAGRRRRSWAAQKRSTLGAALMFTAPGIPMLFQGQEFLEGEWFQRHGAAGLGPRRGVPRHPPPLPRPDPAAPQPAGAAGGCAAAASRSSTSTRPTR